jgi:uncharacterized membrane protein
LVDGTTFHLAPVIVAAASPISFPARRVRASLVGTTIATAAAMLLAVVGRMAGPSLLPIGGALLESVLGALLGGVIGLMVASAGLTHTAPGDPA